MARRYRRVHPGRRRVQRVSAQLTVLVLLDGAESPVEVVADNREYVAWDMVAPQRKWPKKTDAEMLWVTYLAWHALKRQNRYDKDFDAFRVHDCVSVELVESRDVDPTPPTPGVG